MGSQRTWITVTAAILTIGMFASMAGAAKPNKPAIVKPSATKPPLNKLPIAEKPKEVPNWVAVLGDSYAAGTGANDNGSGKNYRSDAKYFGCDVSHNSYSDRAVSNYINAYKLNVGYETFACQGSVSTNVWNAAKADYCPDGACHETQLDALKIVQKAKGFPPLLIVVSTGGNDAGFADILKLCVATNSLSRAADVFAYVPLPSTVAARYVAEQIDSKKCFRLIRKIIEDGRGSQRTYINNVINAIRSSKAFSASTIVIAGYPILFSTSGKTNCAVSRETATLIREATEEVNSGSRLAAKGRAAYLDMDPLFEGHRLCEGNGSEFFRPIHDKARDSRAPGHPNRLGHLAMAEKLGASCLVPSRGSNVPKPNNELCGPYGQTPGSQSRKPWNSGLSVIPFGQSDKLSWSRNPAALAYSVFISTPGTGYWRPFAETASSTTSLNVDAKLFEKNACYLVAAVTVPGVRYSENKCADGRLIPGIS
jgi:GDSL-like Lipase/Acylhydrolase family